MKFQLPIEVSVKNEVSNCGFSSKTKVSIDNYGFSLKKKPQLSI